MKTPSPSLDLAEPIEPIDQDAAAEQRREEAFIAPNFSWKGIPLAPLAMGREAAWVQHARRIGLPPLDDVINSSEGWLSYGYRLLFFVANEPRVWLSIWMNGGSASPIILEKRIDQWAGEHIAPGDQIAVIKLSLAIYDRAHLNQATIVETEDAGGPGEGSGRSPLRKKSCSSRKRVPASTLKTTSSITSRRSAPAPTSTAAASRRATCIRGRTSSRKKKRN